MNCSVNLVPTACLNARARYVRRNRWIGVSAGFGTLIAVAWILQLLGTLASNRLEDRLAYLQARQADLDRQLSMSVKAREELFQKVRGLCHLRRREPTPDYLVQLARSAPSGVVFTELSVKPAAPAAFVAAAPPPAPAGAAPKGPAASQPAPQRFRSVQVAGVALDHQQLNLLIEALKAVPSWERVELIRAARENFETYPVVAFRLECRQMEPTP